MMTGTWHGFDSIRKKEVLLEMDVLNRGQIEFIDPMCVKTEKAQVIIRSGSLLFDGFYFFSNNEVDIRCNYIEGKRVGQERIYNHKTNSLTYIEWNMDSVYRVKLFYGNENGVMSDQIVDLYNDSNKTFNISYFNNGVIKECGLKIESHRVGEWSLFYENGQLESHGEYFPDYVRKIAFRDTYIFVDKNGNAAESLYPKLDFKNIDIGEIYYLKTGKWVYYDVNGNRIKIEVYRNGILRRKKY
jgi:antitoxin component YwqK of YwqJK toxin-antitoxin module